MNKQGFNAQSRRKGMIVTSAMFLLLAIAVVSGYSVGKNMALRDNARNAAVFTAN